MKKIQYVLGLIIIICIIAVLYRNTSTELRQDLKNWATETFFKRPTKEVEIEVPIEDEDTGEVHEEKATITYPAFHYTTEQLNNRVLECAERYNISLNVYNSLTHLESYGGDFYATNFEKNVLSSIQRKGNYYYDIPKEWRKYATHGSEYYLAMSCGPLQVQTIYGYRASLEMPDITITHPAQMADPMINICVGFKMLRDCFDNQVISAFASKGSLTLAFAKCHNGSETKRINPKWHPGLEKGIAEGVMFEHLDPTLVKKVIEAQKKKKAVEAQKKKKAVEAQKKKKAVEAQKKKEKKNAKKSKL